MPHITLEYSANLEPDLDVGALCDALRVAAIETDVFPVAGIRVRALRADHYSIADGQALHVFIDIGVRLRGGRDLDTRKAASGHIFEAAKAFVAPLMDRRSVALSLEMRNIDPELSPKSGNIREYLAT